MSRISIRRAHALSQDEARERLGAFEEILARYKTRLAWRGHTAAIKGVGVSGDVKVHPREVEIQVKLGMLARAAGVDPKRLEASIRRRLDEAYGEG